MTARLAYPALILFTLAWFATASIGASLPAHPEPVEGAGGP